MPRRLAEGRAGERPVESSAPGEALIAIANAISQTCVGSGADNHFEAKGV